MTEKRTIKRAARQATTSDAAERKQAIKAGTRIPGTTMTVDSFQNFAQQLGIGTDQALTTSGWGFNPVTRIRTLLEWMHRGDWLCGAAVDIIAEDMTRAGVSMLGELKPQLIEKINERAVTLGIWEDICDTIKWSRLYGGCVAAMLIDGQRMESPLRAETVGKDQFKGLLVLDRWQVDSSLSDLVTELGPSLGLPKYYTVLDSAPALPGTKIHHSRCLRLEGIKLPFWQRMQENLWGISVLERLYDRLIYVNSATAGAAQLAYKSYIRCYKIDSLREIISAGGPALQGLQSQIQFMRATQGQEGLTLIDTKDEFVVNAANTFGGLNELLRQLFEQTAGALQMPLVRLLGMSPGGMNSTGDSDLFTYYDGIKQKQNRDLLSWVTVLYRILAQSLGIKLPDGFGIEFNPLWQVRDQDRATMAAAVTTAVAQAKQDIGISDRTALKELKQSSRVTGIFSNITDEELEAADDLPVPPVPEGDENTLGDEINSGIYDAKRDKIKGVNTADRASTIHEEFEFQGMPIAIENPVGSTRIGQTQDGKSWNVTFSHPYGFIKNTMGTDGDSLDCFIGPNEDARTVYVVHQRNSGGGYDEDKAMLGFNSWSEARDAYLQNNHSDIPLGSMSKYAVEDFKRRLFRAPGISK